ncbi:hypothetical protein AAG570_000438 [Ranatra chinensis]|uniref:N-acetyltransferase domain-containing protein n=1 Tax=Ranatra chinensis TaxID=642074 RepID=A0ABD0YX16_9HEMI
MQTLWRKTMESGASLVAILEGPGGPDHNIVGANITGVSHKKIKEMGQCHGKQFKGALRTALAITDEGDLFEKYGVENYLTAYGLSVHPDYHGLEIGYKLLESREYVCKELDLKMTGTVFTAAASQHLAKKAGFEVVVEREFKDYNVNGIVYFPNMPGKLMLMAKTYS